MTLRAFLARLAMMSRFVAACLVTIVCLRFGVAGFQSALAAGEPAATARPSPHDGRPRAVASAGAAASDPSPAGSSDKPVRVTLAVTAGPPRSLVLVNGQRLGNSPFVGDLSCKLGHDVRIEVVPDREPAMRFLRRCRGGTIRITSRDDPAEPVTAGAPGPP